ncbi:zinc finger protein 443 [Ixodes scapularis]|uniref:zinc finger protein 443 n=1 Tax=Ixodes scapularis TaxID=6945 RepID=UPI001C3874AE|nr:zinc finger protein 443 [Ixodes scapularis]
MFVATCYSAPDPATEGAQDLPAQPCMSEDSPCAVGREREIERDPLLEGVNVETIIGSAPQWPAEWPSNEPGLPVTLQKPPSDSIVTPERMPSHSEASPSSVSAVVPANGATRLTFLKCVDSSGRVLLLPTASPSNGTRFLATSMASWATKNDANTSTSCTVSTGRQLSPAPASSVATTTVHPAVTQAVVPTTGLTVAHAAMPMAAVGSAPVGSAPVGHRRLTVGSKTYAAVVLRTSNGSDDRILLIPSSSPKPKGPVVASGSSLTSDGSLQNVSEGTPGKSPLATPQSVVSDEGQRKHLWDPPDFMLETKALQERLSSIWLRDFQELDQAIVAVASLFPLVCSHRVRRLACFPFAAVDSDTYLKWPTPKQRASEWLRASDVRRVLRKKMGEQRPVSWAWSKEMITRKKIMLLCRSRGLVPSASAADHLQAKGDVISARPIPTGKQPLEHQQSSTTFPNKNKLTPDASSGPSGDPDVSSESSRSRQRPSTAELHECEYCLAVFPKRNSLERHVAIHTGDTPYECRFCPMSFANKDDLTKHAPSHAGEHSFNCSVCAKSFHTRAQLVTHRLSHTPKGPHGCPKCSASFYLKSSFDAHLKYHVPHQCSLCSASFSGEDELARHARSHVGEPLFKRGAYAAGFHTGALRSVPKIAHTFKTMHKCPRCPRTFSLRSSLDAHLECHSLHKCRFCPVFFADEASLARHVCSRKRHVLWRSHVKKHPFVCNTCAARFRTMTELVVHGLTHASKKRHRCPQCTSSFYLRSSLDTHLRCHTFERSFATL